MTTDRCPIHDEPLIRCPDSLEILCPECSLEYAQHQTDLAIDEYHRDVDTMPKFTEPWVCESDHPF